MESVFDIDSAENSNRTFKEKKIPQKKVKCNANFFFGIRITSEPILRKVLDVRLTHLSFYFSIFQRSKKA
jgi:hypothetical protein